MSELCDEEKREQGHEPGEYFDPNYVRGTADG